MDYKTLQKALADAENKENEHDLVTAGKLFVLPSSCNEGSRYMRQKVHDIVFISNNLGRFLSFVTTTCNLVWPETIRKLLESQVAQDRPDLSARLLHTKR